MLTGKQLRKLIRSLPTDGSAGDINQITATATGQAPAIAAPTPPPAPARIKPPTQQNATIASAGAGVGSGKSRKRMRSGALRIARRGSAANTGTTRGRLNY